METFNYKQYILNYPDLQEAGICNLRQAWTHYRRFGLTEGRTDLCGINNVDIFYYINLDHREDRFEHINNQFKKYGLDPVKINKVSGILNLDKGIIGCTQSHCKVLEKFIESGLNNCIIFEDDFTFTETPEVVNSKFNEFFKSGYFHDFDLVMLAGSTMTEYSLTDFLTRVHHSQTTSGYMVSKSFAPILLENFRETDMLDVNWLKLQPVSKWYSFSPRLGLQMESYSDITHKLENYRL